MICFARRWHQGYLEAFTEFKPYERNVSTAPTRYILSSRYILYSPIYDFSLLHGSAEVARSLQDGVACAYEEGILAKQSYLYNVVFQY
jgi:hypothetical protein